jgi:signal peptidase I
LRPRPGQLGAALLAVFLALALAGVLAPALGWRLDVVQSGSMSPAIGVGDLVITSPCDPREVVPGDVISFRSGDALVCHRVVAVDDGGQTVITKGDANEGPDPQPVPLGQVTGKVAASVPLLGYAVSFLRSPFGWALIALLAVLVLVAGRDEGREDPKEGKQ